MSYQSQPILDYVSSTTHQQDIIDMHRKAQKKASERVKISDPKQQGPSIHTNPDKVTKSTATAASQKINPRQLYTPKFKWAMDTSDQTFNIIPEEKPIASSPLLPLESSSNHVLGIFGYKIDISSRVNELMQKLQKAFIQSKSHNALVGKFSELKFGMLSALLSLLGIEPNTLEKLKKDALKKAMDDNIDNFYQNEYNTELLIIFKKGKKDGSRIKILSEVQKQLIKQMAKFGKPDFYNSDRINTIKKDQNKKILMDLLDEKQNLDYIRSFR